MGLSHFCNMYLDISCVLMTDCKWKHHWSDTAQWAHEKLNEHPSPLTCGVFFFLFWGLGVWVFLFVCFFNLLGRSREKGPIIYFDNGRVLKYFEKSWHYGNNLSEQHMRYWVAGEVEKFAFFFPSWNHLDFLDQHSKCQPEPRCLCTGALTS